MVDKVVVCAGSEGLSPERIFFFLYFQKMVLAFCSLLAIVCIFKVIVALASLGLCLRSMRGQSSRPLVRCQGAAAEQCGSGQ